MGRFRTIREEQARTEIGVTHFSRGVSRFLAIVFAASVCAAGIIQAIYDRAFVSEKDAKGQSIDSQCELGDLLPSSVEVSYLRHGGEPPTSLSPIASIYKQTNGELPGLTSRFLILNARLLQSIERYETCLDDSSLLTEHIIPLVRSVTIGLLSSGSDNGLVGRAGWLFFKPDVDYVLGRPFLDPKEMRKRRITEKKWPEVVEPDPIAAIVDFANQLKTRGIELIVIPTPVKPMIYPDKYSSRFTGHTGFLQNPSFDVFLERLESEGVRVFNLSESLSDARSVEREELYLKTDTHWSPRGVELAAGKLADYIRDKGLALGAEKRSYFRKPKAVENRGDIAVMLNNKGGPRPIAPETTTIAQVYDGDDKPFIADRTASILLLGDSFTNIYSLAGMNWGEHAGFAEQLAAELGRPVDVIAQNDSGAYATRRALARMLSRGEDRLEGKTLVVYQFAARELMFGDWKTSIDLSKKKPRSEPTEHAIDLDITGTISDIVTSPSPGAVAYKDCYIPIHLSQITSADGTETPREAVIYVWGMLDGKLTAYNRLKRGDKVTLPVIPFSDVESRFGRYRHEEFTDVRLFELPTYWGDTRAPAADSDVSVPAPSTQPSAAAEDSTGVIKGLDDWLFLSSEIEHLAAGRFWGEAAASVSQSRNKANADPLSAIVDFKEQLDKIGVSLIIVPVPAKATVYSDKLNAEIEKSKLADIEKSRTIHQQFFKELAGQGIDVLDLTSVFLENRRQGEQTYCKQDSHWSGIACAIAAKQIAEKIRNASWYGSIPKHVYRSAQKTITLSGDLWSKLTEPRPKRETLSVWTVDGTDSSTTSIWRESPVLVLADSHGLVFHSGGDMHAERAGLVDHLALELGFGVDLVAVRGSGATPARVSLMRRGDNLKGKKTVVWVFATREFSQSRTGWARVPVVR